MRYAIFAAVSSERQAADDKISLTDQEDRARATANARGWVETAGPFIVPGESRTQFINLRDAEAAIPELRQMLDAAQRGRFDVLIIYHYNRLRELIDPVSRTLAAYKIQVYSITQPVEPQPPETYNQYKSDASWIMQLTSQLISKSQISDLRRKYEIGMPARVQKRGLPPIGIPFGYRKPPGRETDRNAIPEIDPVTGPMVAKFKDLLLAGRTLSQLVKFATGTGIKPPRGRGWYPQTIRAMLRNPFYAGFVRWGITKNTTDPRTGKQYRDSNPQGEIITQRGVHTPLWDEETHARILAELRARGTNYGEKKQNAITRLLRCAKCNQALWMQHNGSRAEPGRSIWRCQTPNCRGANILHSRALAQVAAKLAELVAQNQPVNIPQPITPQPDHLEQNQLTDLQNRRNRLTDIYLAGGIGKPEYLQRAAEIDHLITQAEDAIVAIEHANSTMTQRLQILQSFSGYADHVPEWLHNANPQEVNRILRALFDHIDIDGETITAIELK